MKCIINGKLILPNQIVEGKAIVFDKKIEAIVDPAELNKYENLEVIDAEGNYVSPGLVEVHMHGCGGDDTSDNNPGAIQRMSKMIAGFGVTSWLPTSMTLLKESHTYDLRGIACIYHLDTGSRIVEMKDDGGCSITGLIDACNLPTLIHELQEILAILEKGE